MSAEPLALAYQLADLKQLDSKPFNKYPRGYLQAVRKRLTDSEYSTFLEIREESFKNYKTGGLIIKSAYEIGESRDRSARTIERHLSSIKEKGFIDLETLKSGKGIYRRNCIRLACPQDVLNEILIGSQDIPKTDKKHNTVYLCPTKMPEYSDKNANHPFNNRYIVEPNIKSNIKEKIHLDDLEPCNDQVEVLGELESNVPQRNQAPNIQAEKVATGPQPDSFDALEQTACKPEAEVARFITKAERIEVVKKLKAMRKAGEMHASVQARYPDLTVLIQEVIFFCMYRPKYYRSFKHAKNTAALKLRNGSWTTPKGLEWERTQMREQQSELEKQREIMACRGSGIGQTLGRALRESYTGPSEVDIAKRKAAVTEQGIQELGPNPTAGQVHALRDTVQQRFNGQSKAENKPVERIYSTHEENIAWYSGLKDEDKMACYEYAVRKHAAFGMTLSSKGIDYRGAEFLETTWFKQMMELIGRAN